jgi:hypothetical protein
LKVRSVRFLHDVEEIRLVDKEERALEITSQPVTELKEQRHTMSLAGEGHHGMKPVTYLVRYSNDGGESWLGRAADLTEPRSVADLDRPQGGALYFPVSCLGEHPDHKGREGPVLTR